ncbi:alanine racemase [Mycobacterium sp. ACS4331]|uniref:alanine racemase n=1 Tax=Mycobacterium sp. ACS4331 TaxID=1834121 RepID=UPI00080061E8|nr:alanine racemase [Mycobacterium sp. ACS4331]OBF13774.1 alanine racemase [Mycobacterium sp. ACS4331]
MSTFGAESATVTPTAEAVVDLGAIAHNVRLLKEHAGSAAVMAVVKADGYGHGAAPVARAALEAGAAELGVATVSEALSLRNSGVDAPVLAWLHAPGTDFAPALAADVQLAVSSLAQLDEVLDAVRRTGITAEVTVKVDTGLNRNGVPEDEFDQLAIALRRAVSADAVRIRGMMSHLACGDEPEHPANDGQYEAFTRLCDRARRMGLEFELAHLSNSAATIARHDLAFDMVRTGLAVYGLSPIAGRAASGFIPAMTLKTPVALVKPVRAGEAVSYGRTWVADRDTTVALLPVGYADGVFRGLGGRLEVGINGVRRRSVGRVCMDQFVVDLGPGTTDVCVGDEAILFGPGDSGEQTAQDWADLMDTINYEVVTSPRGRVVRTYLQAGGRCARGEFDVCRCAPGSGCEK